MSYTDFLKSKIKLARKEGVALEVSNINPALKPHNQMVKKMTDIIKKYGLSHQEMAKVLTRNLGVERIEIKKKRYTISHNDNVPETKAMKTNSVGLIHTSIPFSMQYEYSPNYADFGHSESNEEFFKQMDFLTPELLRVLQPGRIAAIHVKDRTITQFSNEGDVVYDPFGGLMTVPYRAILLNRIGRGCELNHQYFLDGAQYCRAAEDKMEMPTLFDAIEEPEQVSA